MRSKRALAPLVLVACILAIGCAKADEMSETPPASSMSSGGPRVNITSPAEGATVAADSVEVVMTVEGVKLVPAAAARVEGEGHLHIFVDIDVSRADIPIPVGDVNVVHMGTGVSTYKFPVLAAGPHRLIAVYAYGDHTPDIKVATDTLNIIVR